MPNMERILASEAQPIGAGGQNQITLLADQGMSVDLGRLVIQVFDGQGAGGGQASPTSLDASAAISIFGFFIKNTTNMVRGLVAGGVQPNINVGVFSGYRSYTPYRLTAKGQFLRMEAGETIVIQLANLIGGPTNAVASAGVPAILDCDKGIEAYPAGFNASQGCAMIGSGVAQGGTNPTPPGVINSFIGAPALVFQEAGWIDISNLNLSASATNQFPVVVGDNEATETTYQTAVNQIQDISSSNLVVGTPDNPGNNLAAPGSMLWAPQSAGGRHRPWVRLPVQRGSSGNQIIPTIEVYSNDVNAMTWASAPFYPGRGSKPPIGCV